MTHTLAVQVTVNGKSIQHTLPVRMTLADFLRHECQLTGTHLGCEHGVCGACTVLLDGRSARSCLTLAVQADGMEVTTIEGLSDSDVLNPLQQAFMDEHGLQCGFCTPGMLTTLTELLDNNSDPSDDDIRQAISGNLCRCTGYENIVRAAKTAARYRRDGMPAPSQEIV